MAFSMFDIGLPSCSRKNFKQQRNNKENQLKSNLSLTCMVFDYDV
jgi:hypothetical protein